MRWLAIVGIGEDGVAGLGEHARALIADAELVFGGKRHLELAAGLVTGEAHSWTSPLAGSLDEIVAARGRRVAADRGVYRDRVKRQARDAAWSCGRPAKPPAPPAHCARCSMARAPAMTPDTAVAAAPSERPLRSRDARHRLTRCREP